MRKWLNSSFRRKLMAAFLAVGVIPLLTCTVLMLNVFRISLAQEAEETAVSQLNTIVGDMERLIRSCEDAMAALRHNQGIAQALTSRPQEERQAIYNTL